ncbi:MAG TPA: formylglycine-generating enzyme family protein [Candidatus Eisenbacteria bacterium]|nr:formylglycine-generating enzyme family protein [Candidatus Eisenbacteria bacterium]
MRARGDGARLVLAALALAVPIGIASCGKRPSAERASSGSILVTEFLPTVEDSARPEGDSPEGMVWIPGGEFSMGAADVPGGNEVDAHAVLDSRPVHRVHVDGFWMDRTEVTNDQFARFVAATGYLTVAERVPRVEDYPGAPPENLVAGSVVFERPDTAVALNDRYQWWIYRPGASWRHPQGPGSDVRGKGSHPVVHIAFEDARAYAVWAGKRLPTEAEWEFAARGGIAGALYPWGNELRPEGVWHANIFQGQFPDRDRAEDGFAGLAPVGQYAPNGYGLLDVAGNAWEWVSDWYRSDTYAERAAPGVIARNPVGPPSSHDPAEPGIPKRVHRGGSFLCTDQYCSRYLVGTRSKGAVDTGTDHLGFRCARSPRAAGE